MQIDVSPCRGCDFDKSNFFKVKNSRDTKLGNAKCSSTKSNRHKNLGKSRRLKSHNSSANHHRLDHTYAAASSINKIMPLDLTEKKYNANYESIFESTTDENEEIEMKSSWLRNLCLEYQPCKNHSRTKVQSDTVKEKSSSSNFSGFNGTLKQYHRNRKNITKKSESTFLETNKMIKSVQEDQKRWIAALALIELAQSQ